MKVDIKSFLIGVLVTINALMLYSFNSESNMEHTHSADEITYSTYGYGGYGTLKKKIKDIESHDHDYEYADDSHSHYEYADSYHWH